MDLGAVVMQWLAYIGAFCAGGAVMLLAGYLFLRWAVRSAVGSWFGW